MKRRALTWLSSLGLAGLLAIGGCALLGPSDEELIAIRAALDAPRALLLDVRTPEEHAEGHLKGALNIPVDDLAVRLTELEPKDRPVVVFCRSGFRSSRAAEILREAGFRDVHDLGGMSNGEDVPLETVR